jgi:DNA-binding NarL/FixJ family response regulator
MNLRPIKLILLDDHPLVGRSLAHYLKSVYANMEVDVVTSIQELNTQIKGEQYPDILVADVWLTTGDTFSRLALLRQQCPSITCLVMSGDTDPSIPNRVRAVGAQGFIQKQSSPEQFVLAINTLLKGGEWFSNAYTTETSATSSQKWEVTPNELGLTERQGEILGLLLRGLPNKRIASALSLSESTVKEHVTGILERLGARNRIEVITLFNHRRIKLSSANG